MHKKQIRPLARLHGYWLWRRVLTPMESWPRERRRCSFSGKKSHDAGDDTLRVAAQTLDCSGAQ